MYKILEDLKSVALRASPFMFLAHKKHTIKGFEIINTHTVRWSLLFHKRTISIFYHI